MFFHQIMICGKTGSGKTVAMKYFAQYFIEEMEGAVLAINVKDIDFLTMDKPTNFDDSQTLAEWKTLGEAARGIRNLTMYMPANRRLELIRGISTDHCQKITLDVNQIRPESLIGLLQGISDKGSMSLPGIFRYWREFVSINENSKFSIFVKYFNESENRSFSTLSDRREEGYITLHSGTYDNISRSLDSALDFFDNPDATALDYYHILEKGKMSVLDFSGENGPRFGSILLRDLLKKIVEAKNQLLNDVPILIIIDEVHQFYNTESTREALSDLDTICRIGRNKKIGIIFASQSINDIPRDLPSVVNTQIFFKTDAQSVKKIGVKSSLEELEGLKSGFAITSIHDLHQLKFVKFPISFSGVIKHE